jgi:DeoR/GlpR family transcriptional regulator of sugar metabolism
MRNESTREITAEERRKQIMELLIRDGKVKVNALSEIFNISEVSIRNDLSDLESKGMLQRIHGGAITTSKAYYNMSFQERMQTNRDEKFRIARATADLIDSYDSVFFNSGTTTLYTARQLIEHKNLLIVTNAVSISTEIGHYDGINLILLGGNYQPQYQFTYGDDTLNNLKKYNADKLVIAIDGIHPEKGITSFLHLESEIDRQMLQRARRVIAVADHTKINRISFSYIDKVEAIDTLVTDKKADKNTLSLLQEKGVQVITV